MRIQVIQKPTEHLIDGFRLDGFVVGHVYDVDSTIAAVFLAEGWGVPLPTEYAAERPRRETIPPRVSRKRSD